MQSSDKTKRKTRVGTHYAGPQDYEKASGSLPFATDLAFPGMVYAVAYRSSIPHGRLLRLDVETAQRAPGVLAVLTADDVPGQKEYGYIYPDTPVLAYDRLHCVGEPIALVVAETYGQAEDACAYIQCEWEELPGVFSFEAALDPAMPAIHPGGNLLRHNVLHKGDVFHQGEYRVTGSFSTQLVAHMYLELECSAALYEQGKLTVYSATQDIFSDRAQICGALRLKPEEVRVVQANTGGAFGGKLDITTELLAALAAYHVHRPVRVSFNRRESMQMAPKRHPMRFDLELAADGDGRFLSLKGKAFSDTGAFASSGDKVLRKALANITGPYSVPNIHIDGYTVYTNNPQAGAMRGFGQCQSSFAFESLVDMLANEMRMDGKLLRERNFLQPGDTNAVGIPVPRAMRVHSTYEALCAYLAAHPFAPPDDGRAYGTGFANTMFAAGLGFGRTDQATVRLCLGPKNGWVLSAGAADIGQGAASTFAMLCAEALGIEASCIRVVLADTSATPMCGPTTATRLTATVGNAILDAAKKMLALLSDTFTANFGQEAGAMVTLDGEGVKAGQCRLTYRELAAYCQAHGISLETVGFADGTSSPEDPQTLQGRVFNTYVWGSQAVDLAVDLETGEIEILRAVAAFDVGRAVDPKRVAGQIEGGVAMALGMALHEKLQLDNGFVRTADFSTYLIPTAMDAPEIVSIVVETADKAGPYGAKGIGEPPTQGIAAACANALFNATGARITELPLSPERILMALHGHSD